MKFYIGVTDNDWFDFLSSRVPEEVNFWRPRNQNDFRAIGKGDLFLFKLHSPYNFIVGGGFLLKHEFLPLRLAWDTFGLNNGVPNFELLERAIQRHRTAETRNDPLGCTVLVEPFFWPKSAWLPIPEDWKGNIVSGKTYESEGAGSVGNKLWQDVRERLMAGFVPEGSLAVEEPPAERYGKPHLVCPRLGQGAFRIAVSDAYRRRCAVTGERTLPALAASHIQPYGKFGPHRIPNGILLRSDLHSLFDLGYVTVTLDYRFQVSSRIKKEFENGRHYYAFDGQPLNVIPAQPEDRPDPVYLEWHRQNCFLG